jgi:hypothetical protein
METKWTIHNFTLICSNEIETKYSELYISSRSLSYGIYELKLTVRMSISLDSMSSESIFVKIIPSGIAVNLVQFGTSMITRGN